MIVAAVSTIKTANAPPKPKATGQKGDVEMQEACPKCGNKNLNILATKQYTEIVSPRTGKVLKRELLSGAIFFSMCVNADGQAKAYRSKFT